MDSIDQRTILLGIDPSFITMGCSLYDPSKKQLKLNTGDLFNSLDWLGKNCKMKNVIARVENPALDKAVFKVWFMVENAIKDYVKYQLWSFTKRGPAVPITTIDHVRSKFSIALNYAQKVGENKAAAKLIIKMLHQRNVPVLEVAPSKRDKAFKEIYDKKLHKKKKVLQNVKFLKMPTKTTAEQFKELTGYSKRSSEHARDAATLVYGRTMVWARTQAKIIRAQQESQPSSYPATHNDNISIIDRKKKELPF